MPLRIHWYNVFHITDLGECKHFYCGKLFKSVMSRDICKTADLRHISRQKHVYSPAEQLHASHHLVTGSNGFREVVRFCSWQT